MDNIVFNRESGQVTGISRQPLPFEYEVRLPFPITLSKAVSEPTGNKVQKVDEEGLPLYKQPDYDDLGNPSDIIYVETTQSREVTEWKEVPYTYRIQVGEKKEVSYVTEDVVVGYEDKEVSSTNEIGEIITETVQVPITEPQTKEVDIFTPIYEEITTASQEPAEWVDHEPVMVEEFHNVIRTLEDSFTLFNYTEVLEAKKAAINKSSLPQLVFYDEDFDSGEVVENCSKGDGLIVIHSGGEVMFGPVKLPAPTDLVNVYVEAQKDVVVEISGDGTNFITAADGMTTLPDKASDVWVRVTSSASTNRELYALGVLA